MVKSLRESKAKLSELVDLASRGEDVLISVRGKVKARLTGVQMPLPATTGAKWARELRGLHRAYSSGKASVSIDQILSAQRADRG
jgi:prevent-host-death family protein